MSDYVVVEKDIIQKLRKLGINKGFEIMLYCKIESMSSKTGYCTASNRYFAELLGMSTRNVQRYIAELAKLKIIKTYEHKTGSFTEARKIYPQILEDTELKEDVNNNDVSEEIPEEIGNEQEREDRIKYFQSLSYDAMVDNESLPRIVFRVYKDIDHDIHDPADDKKYLLKTFTGGFYQAKNTENITELIDAVLNKEIYFSE